ncbi:MAG: hypothetical protein WKF80_10845 [Thermomicrobiales bacterium]
MRDPTTDRTPSPDPTPTPTGQEARRGGPPGIDLNRVWLGVTAVVWSRPVGPVERLLGRLLGSRGAARALLTTPSLALSWVLASVAILGLGILATQASEQGTPWFALVAPAVAAIAIAHAYGPGIDPAFELSQTMVVSDRVILLSRGTIVFTLNAVLTLLASFLVPATSVVAWSWLVPMAAVSSLALAVSVASQSPNLGVAVAIATWFGFVIALGDTRTRDFDAVLAGSVMPVYIVATVAFIAVTLYTTSGPRAEVRRWQ